MTYEEQREYDRVRCELARTRRELEVAEARIEAIDRGLDDALQKLRDVIAQRDALQAALTHGEFENG